MHFSAKVCNLGDADAVGEVLRIHSNPGTFPCIFYSIGSAR